MFTLYRITFAPARNTTQHSGFCSHKNGDLGSISVTERAEPRRSRKWSVTYRIGEGQESDRNGSEQEDA